MVKLFNFFKRDFMEWQEYKKKIDIIDDFYWRQNIIKQNLRNL